MLGKLIVNETLRNLEEWLWRFVCLDKYGLTLTNICLDAWHWLLVWLFRGLMAPVYFCSGCMEVFGGFCWNIFLILTLYNIATAWISLLF